ncbi:Up-regulated during septation-domain-containing protein [Russula dissimulans]|nr:Up-regulated during septation-domain-containing protein [Russula dissimulans]
MNGVRRFLSNATSEPPPTPAIKDRTSTPSRPSSPTKELPPHSATKGLFIRKDRKPLPPVSGPSSTPSSPTTSTPPPRRKPPPSERDETSPPSHDHANGNGVRRASTRDALLLSLLSSEAMVDSRDYVILSTEEVEELNKEHTVLSSRVVALQRKLKTELKIRDAAQNLARLNSSSPSPTRISRQSKDAHQTAERKVEAAQTELWRVQERAANIGRRLLEHRAGVLGAALAVAERAHAKEHAVLDPDSSYDQLSSPTTAAVAAPKFDGAHLFAGHEDAVVPGRHSSPSRDAAARGGSASRNELEELEEKLAAADARAQELEALLEDERLAAASDLEGVRAAAAAELADVRAASASELARAQGHAGELEGRVAKLEQELETSIRGREDAAYLEERIRTLESDLRTAESKAEQVRTEAEAAAAVWVTEKASWVSERAVFEQERGRWAGLSETLENSRALWEQEREELVAVTKDQIADAADGLHDLVRRYEVPLFSRESGIGVLVDALGRYLEKHNAYAFEQLLAVEVERREAMARELETAKVEIRTLQARSLDLKASPIEPRPSSPVTFARDAAGFVSVLLPIWSILPSPEARAARLSSAARPFRAGSGRTSPGARGGGRGSPGPNAVSISDMDVRALKSLYSHGGGAGSTSARASTGSSDSPNSPVDGPAVGVFSVEAFAQRVQSLISDDRALMERLIRFAHAHDLLKKNAERAQKLAQESNGALETYQRQVHTLEEHLARASGWEDQVQQLAAEKLEAEKRAAEQAETLRQLNEANAALSARALQLAQDVSKAEDELRAVHSVSEREQEQRLALLEEINLVQTENGNFRQQLRALGKL